MLLYNEVDLNVTFPKALLGNCFIDRSFVCLCAALSVTHTFKVIDLIGGPLYLCPEFTSFRELLGFDSTEKACTNLSYCP